MSALFRREAIDGQSLAWLGEVRLARPPSMTLLAVVAATAAVAVFAFLMLGELAPTARLSGALVPVPEGNASTPGPLQAVICAPSATVGLLRPGQSVRLRYEAYGPRQGARPAAGRILHVARAPADRRTDAICNAAAADDVATYRVTVGLGSQSVEAEGAAQPLVAGARVQAEVVLERRRILQWMFGNGGVMPGGNG